MTDSSKPPPKPTAFTVLPDQDANGVVVSHTLVTEGRAALAKQFRNALVSKYGMPGGGYHIKYFLYDNNQEPPPTGFDAFKQIKNDFVLEETTKNSTRRIPAPYIREDNPVIPLNDAMHEAVRAAFATIEAQMPGRFSFVRTTNSQEADLRIAAIPKSMTVRGVTNVWNRSILLSADAFDPERFSSPMMTQTALHELGHALGLAHPFSEPDRLRHEPSSKEVSYLQSVMTYEANNAKAVTPLDKQLYPVTLMPSDIAALEDLYPIATELSKGVASSNVAFVADTPECVSIRILSEDKAQNISFPQPGGIAFIPLPDSQDDRLAISLQGVDRCSYMEIQRIDSPNRTQIILSNLGKSGELEKRAVLLPMNIEQQTQVSFSGSCSDASPGHGLPDEVVPPKGRVPMKSDR